MTVKPFSPDEAKAAHVHSIPNEVIDTVNRLLGERFYNTNHSVTIYQDEVVEAVVALGLSKADLFDKHWLDFEPVYEKQGWSVTYDKPGFNESYPASWVFRKRRKK